MAQPEERAELERALDALADGTPIEMAALAGVDEPTRRALETIQRVSGAARAQPDPLERRFERLELLGRGSHGEVWKARDRVLGRCVALKLFPAAPLAQPKERKRYLVEARQLAAVEHENVVRIHSIEESARGIVLVLELVEGRTLQQVVEREGPLSAAEAAGVGIALCRALAAIHGAGILHRDVKPANVMRAGGGRVVLLDFGIARSRAALALDATANPIGTPMFMPPEELLEGQESGAGSDLYALGATLFWLATGQCPYSAKSLTELVAQAHAGRARRLTDLRPDLPLRFVEIVERAIAPEPAQRFATAGELEEALRGFLAGEEVRPQQAPRSRLARWSALAAGTVLVSLAAALLLHSGAGAFQFDMRWSLVPGGAPDRQPIALAAGSSVDVGDGLRLELQCSAPAFVYVFNEDAEGVLSRLTPHPDYELAQPVQAGSWVRLPGHERLERGDFWRVNTRGGGSESFVVVAAPARLAAVETIAAGVPIARVVLLDALRSVGGHASSGAAPEAGRSIEAQLAALGPEFRPYWQTFELRNAPR